MSIKKSKHIPRKNATSKNVIRCILLSIEERSLLTYNMCGEGVSQKVYNAMLETLEEKGIIRQIDKSIPYSYNTDFIIADYEKANIYMKGNFDKCIKMIARDIIPLLAIYISNIA